MQHVFNFQPHTIAFSTAYCTLHQNATGVAPWRTPLPGAVATLGPHSASLGLPHVAACHWDPLGFPCQSVSTSHISHWILLENCGKLLGVWHCVWFHDLVEGENHALFKPILGLGITVFWCLVRTTERWEEVKHLHKCPLDFAADIGNLRRNSEKQLWTPAVAAEEPIKLRQGSKVKLNIIITYQ